MPLCRTRNDLQVFVVFCSTLLEMQLAWWNSSHQNAKLIPSNLEEMPMAASWGVDGDTSFQQQMLKSPEIAKGPSIGVADM